MKSAHYISVIIPVLNEEKAIYEVLQAIPEWVDEVIVSDNGSTDNTAKIARECKANVVYEPRRGYGSACQTALRELRHPDLVVFLDGDFSDYPEDMDLLVDPIVEGKYDLVIGSRVLGKAEPGALTPQARFGNWLSCLLIRWIWKTRFTDLGPFRALRYKTLQKLDMQDMDYGWTVEMQIKAAKMKIRTLEVPVRYRNRIGKSKISGTVKGVILAGTKILFTIFFHAIGADKTPEP